MLEQILRGLTMLDLSYMFKDMTERNIKATNPYSGQSEMLTPEEHKLYIQIKDCLLYTSPSPRDRTRSRMPSSA